MSLPFTKKSETDKTTKAASVSRKTTTVLLDRLTLLFYVLATVISGYAVIGALSGPSVDLLEVTQSKSADGAAEASPAPVLHKAPSFDAYIQIFASRDIFEAPQEVPAELVAGGQSSVAAWGAGYRLVGIIVDDNPRAVVEISNPRGVQFLSVGERLGDAVLEKIEEYAVSFRYQGQLVQLKFAPVPQP